MLLQVMGKIQESANSTNYWRPKWRILCAYYFVDFERSDKLLQSKYDSEWSLVYTGDDMIIYNCKLLI